MNNLIITIISIGLVAIAAIMAIYYGGIAYDSAQITAAANQILSDSAQITGAYQAYVANGGTLAGYSINGDFSFLVPTYLSALPYGSNYVHVNSDLALKLTNICVLISAVVHGIIAATARTARHIFIFH